MTQDFRPSADDHDPATGRLYRDKWALRQTTFRPSLHIDYDPIVERTNKDPAANATAAEGKTLITALEAHYLALAEKLKVLKQSHPSAMMPGESNIKYRKRVPQWGSLSPEQQFVLVWLAGDRTYVNQAIKALRNGCQPRRNFHGNCDAFTHELFKPFEQRWNEAYRVALDAEEARVRAIIESTPIDDAAWEAYQVQCDRNDARLAVEVAWRHECSHGGRPPSGLSLSDISDILRERAEQRAPEITRARHAREAAAAEEVAQ